jgi:ribosomal protein L37E
MRNTDRSSSSEPAKSLTIKFHFPIRLEGLRLTSSQGFALAVVGIGLAVLGGLGLAIGHEEADLCGYEFYRSYYEERCLTNDVLYYGGILGVILGVILLVIGGIRMGTSRSATAGIQFTCSRCGANISFQNSPNNCFNCGLPMNWSEPQAPQK